jgi:hypothetical protein
MSHAELLEILAEHRSHRALYPGTNGSCVLTSGRDPDQKPCLVYVLAEQLLASGGSR